jgi:hypothetical protein
MVVPAIGFVRELANKAKCGKNQSGIFAALTAYQDGGEPGWPNARWKLGTSTTTTSSAITDPKQMASYTMGIFEILSAQMRDTITLSIFKCPSLSNPQYQPNPEKMPSLTRADVVWGMGNGFMIPYAMDWSAPADAGAPRPLLSDRDAFNHKDKEAVVCYADGHYTTLKRQRGTGNDWAQTKGNASPGYVEGGEEGEGGSSGMPVVINPEGRGAEDATEEDNVQPDNIYDDDGDYPKGKPNRPRMPGSGSSRRGFMK